MLRLILAYVCVGLWMLVLDIIWLSSMIGTYRQNLGDLLAADVRYGPAISFYLLYVAGIVWFAVMPSLDTGDWQKAALNGVLLGLLAYGTYDLTNQATLKSWPTVITLMDMAWGVVLTSTAAVAGVLGVRALHGTP